MRFFDTPRPAGSGPCLPLYILVIALANIPSVSHGQNSSSEDRPNFLFIMVDDLNDWIGLNGPDGHPQAITPYMDALAHSGLYFSNAHCAAAVCAPSRFSTMTGMRPTTTGYVLNSNADDNNDYAAWPTLPTLLRKEGYETLAAGKVYHFGTRCAVGGEEDWDYEKPRFVASEAWMERAHGYGADSNFFLPFPKGGSPLIQRFGYVHGFSLCGAPLEVDDVPEEDMPDSQIADWAIDQIQEKREQPFFLTIGFARPHVPYTAPRKYFDLYDPAKLALPELPEGEMEDIPPAGREIARGFLPGSDHETVLKMGPHYWRELVHAYLACVSFVDFQVGRVLAALEKSPYQHNTVVILMSDHGQELGEKTSWRKMSLWEESTRVPLIITLPSNAQSGATVTEAVSLIDLAPTVLQLAKASPVETHEGESLYPFFKDPTLKRETPAISSWDKDNFAVRDERWRYIRYADGDEELYDHANDPGEHNNLANDPTGSDVKRQLANWLQRL